MCGAAPGGTGNRARNGRISLRGHTRMGRLVRVWAVSSWIPFVRLAAAAMPSPSCWVTRGLAQRAPWRMGEGTGEAARRTEASERAGAVERRREMLAPVAWSRGGVAVKPPERGGQGKGQRRPHRFPLAPPRHRPLAGRLSFSCAVRPNFLLSQSYCQVPTQSTDSARHRTNRKERHGRVG